MTKEFAMLQAAKRLEGYLSKERYNLKKMEENRNVSDGLMLSKSTAYNGLVEALNDLFSNLSGSRDPLFDRYLLEGEDEEDDLVVVDLSSYDSDESSTNDTAPHIAEAMAILGATERSAAYVDSEPELESEQGDVAEEQDDRPEWELQGYATHAEWLADKESEQAERYDDVSVGLNVGLSQHRAAQALDEYNQTTGQNIAEYAPEDDVPVNVLPEDMQDQDGKDEDSEPVDVFSIMVPDESEDDSDDDDDENSDDENSDDEHVDDDSNDLDGDSDDEQESVEPLSEEAADDEYADYIGGSDEDEDNQDYDADDDQEEEHVLERSTSNLDYLHHTIDNERLDNDPTQIVHVETAVEREGENGNRGTDIDIDSYAYATDVAPVDNVIDDEIRKLRKPTAQED